jgi:hypothetical protein
MESGRIEWSFNYKNQIFKNMFVNHPHGDFRFSQNDISLDGYDQYERSFLALLVYSLQKTTSPKIAKQNLNLFLTNYFPNKGNLRENQIYDPYTAVFWSFDSSDSFEFEDFSERKVISKIEGECLTLSIDSSFIKGDKKIIFPSKQICPAIEKLFEAAEKRFHRTPVDSLAYFVDYYSSGKLDEILAELKTFD